jgi:hypothetical protein
LNVSNYVGSHVKLLVGDKLILELLGKALNFH